MQLKRVGVLGAGTAGRGIIRCMAGSGLDVIFCEISEDKVDVALQAIEDCLDQEEESWGVTESEKRLIMSRIRGTTDMRKMAGVQLVIEAIRGTLHFKQDLFQEMDQIFSQDTVLVSNSAALCISDIARNVRHPERIVGMHFCLPVPRRPLVEVVKGRYTSNQAMDTARLVAKLMKKTEIEVFEMPGLITTRVMVPYINEAMHIVMEGLATPAQVDEGIRLGFRLPIGPLAMADTIGLDSLLSDMELMFDALGELQYRPCPLLRRMVREGHLGVKTRQGFFCYDEDGKQVGLPERRANRNPADAPTVPRELAQDPKSY